MLKMQATRINSPALKIFDALHMLPYKSRSG